MSRVRTRNLPRLALAITAVAVGAAVPAVSSAAGDDDGPSIVLENAGDQSNSITLPAPAQVGQTARATIGMLMDFSVEGGGMSTEIGVGLEMVMTAEVTEVTADGGYVAVMTLDDVAITDLPDGTSESDLPCVGVTGVQLEQTFDAAGNTVSMEPIGSGLGSAESACIDQLSSTQSQASVVYPDGPIGPGATWSADIVTENQGMEIPVTYHYTLTDVSDGRYMIETTLDSDFEIDQDGVAASGNMSGSGTASGAVDNPLDSSATFKVAMDMASAIGGEDLTMTIDMSIDVLSEVPTS